MKKIELHQSTRMLGRGVSCQNPRKEVRQDRQTNRWTDKQMDKRTNENKDGGVAMLDKRELGLHITRLLVMT